MCVCGGGGRFGSDGTIAHRPERPMGMLRERKWLWPCRHAYMRNTLCVLHECTSVLADSVAWQKSSLSPDGETTHTLEKTRESLDGDAFWVRESS